MAVPDGTEPRSERRSRIGPTIVVAALIVVLGLVAFGVVRVLG
jgi:hypothetical protein